MSPAPASSGVVVRPAAGAPCEVLLLRRSGASAFMPGAFVFPGGRVDATDRLPVSSPILDARAAARRFADLTPDDERAYRVAALRELYEEAALLVARRGGAFVSAAEADAVRTALVEGLPLADALSTVGLRLAIDALQPIAHWVTPASERRRFDTRFFLIDAPPGQAARHDGGETTDSIWVAPAEAIARSEAGELRLAPPTWTLLARLARCTSIEEVRAWARDVVPARVEPTPASEDDAAFLVLPGDPLFPGPPPEVEVPEITRFAFDDVRGWRPLRRPA